MSKQLAKVAVGVVFTLVLFVAADVNTHAGPVICNGCTDAPLGENESCQGGDLPWSKHKADVHNPRGQRSHPHSVEVWHVLSA
jgi:hypothetical protein